MSFHDTRHVTTPKSSSPKLTSRIKNELLSDKRTSGHQMYIKITSLEKVILIAQNR